MEKVIGLIFEIEQKANQIIERADSEKNLLQEENDKAIADMEANIAAENLIKINTLTAHAEEEFETERKQLIENSKKLLKELKEKEFSYHDTYVAKIVNSIIQLS